MPAVDAKALGRAVEDLPRRYPGPGGAVAVIKDGEVLVRHAWGFANLETRAPYTPATLAPICSITKQFTCATLLDLAPDPSVLDAAVGAQLPRLAGARPTTADLANNQSGLRDYWALTVPSGALPEGDFRPEESARLIALTRSLHFAPGTRYSYSNGNFRMLAMALEQRTGRDFGDLVTERVVRPAGLETAVFAAETAELPGGAVGYEGTAASGWRPGVNRIHWKGDAGLCASLDDMIAWERFIDRTRDDADGIYRRLSRPVTFRNGSPAAYGFGLVRKARWGRAMTGHGGAIRGWRLHRSWVPSERLSVVVAFNHESDSQDAALRVLATALGEVDARQPSGAGAAKPVLGLWLDEEIGLLLDVAANPDGTLSATYAGGAEILHVGPDGAARGLDMTLSPAAGGLRIDRPGDAIRTLARPLGEHDGGAVEGVYLSDELESTFEIIDAGGCWFGGFHGALGRGPLMPMSPAGPGVWRLSCHRSLDAPAPGDWTVRFLDSPRGGRALSLGCWLARDITFERRSRDQIGSDRIRRRRRGGGREI